MPPEMPTTRSRLSLVARTFLTVATLGILGGAGFLAFAGIMARESTVERLRDVSADRAIPTVVATPPSAKNNVVNLELPGRLEPYARAELYARVSGYIANWKFDIGSVVKAGDTLAEIDAPDLDQQLAQAQSDLTNSKVNADLSDLTNGRYQSLQSGTAVSRQTIDEKSADSAAKRALAKSAQAKLDGLLALAQYKKIVAPFDGSITARNTDIGALITAGSSVGSPLFVVANTQRLRLYINVPQNYAPLVKVGTAAGVTVPERPGRVYDAKVEATSGAIDATTGTVRLQLLVDNANGELLSGSYANVSLKLTTTQDVLTVPASALIVDKNGVSVAVVAPDGTIKLKHVTIARDLGKVIEISTGLAKDDAVIESPPDGIVDGDRVRLKEAARKPGSPSAALAPTTGNG